MATEIKGIFEDSLAEKIKSSKILVVGAGGIGCELLKNIVLVGFANIEVIDLDTIDVTNLNRQFLFQKRHVGKSKSTVARESALKFNPDVNIKSYHDSILNPDYGVSFYKKFALVLNALDNNTARNHVNRMCLASGIPLVESGTAGYLGQVSVIKKGDTECFECQPKPRQKTFPGCTIRNTPSEPIHCIVWAKHLFNQLFGEHDADEDVSPDREDPEAAMGDAGKVREDGNVERISTRQWAQDCDYDTPKIFNKLFNDDIQYLLTMDKLWSKRTPPTPLNWKALPVDDKNGQNGNSNNGIKDQAVWSMKQCAEVLEKSINTLKKQFKACSEGDHLVWDKDDDAAMDFVTACANIRSHIFSIQQKSRFDVKSMAGNIIPAIATTNAVIAGCIVMEAIKILNDDFESCRTVYFGSKKRICNRVLNPCLLAKPNPKCYVCAERPEASIKLNLKTTTVKQFEERILKKAFSMIAPDAEIEGRGVIFISSEAGEMECNNDKTLNELGVLDGTIISCDDFMQEYNLKLVLYHSDELEEGVDYVLVSGDLSQLQGQKAEPSTSEDSSTKHKSKAVARITMTILRVKIK
ncbi:SUMO-activating enzyme subunit 2 [Lepeophtheirus salmonis]|uniref:SUMO-activating enzyme subunit 2 n=1 Tax=Lepeophtheirus salmonis TaxID=72036 RepID=UPI001AE92A38|nr:SUMO-activating enzyme subunit 2-like [Lepeophtheirus salmonis]